MKQVKFDWDFNSDSSSEDESSGDGCTPQASGSMPNISISNDLGQNNECENESKESHENHESGGDNQARPIRGHGIGVKSGRDGGRRPREPIQSPSRSEWLDISGSYSDSSNKDFPFTPSK